VQRLDQILTALASERPVFHSEADFQHALAWRMRAENYLVNVRLERRIHLDDEKMRVDIIGARPEGEFALEVKYWTRGAMLAIGGEPFQLVNQAAQDLHRYDFWKDVSRLERLVAQGVVVGGAAVVVSNDASYWNVGREGTVDADFRMPEGQLRGGILRWGPHASAGTTKNREAEITLKSSYEVHWTRYSRPVLGVDLRVAVVRVGQALP
jgi:hypothetical protein